MEEKKVYDEALKFKKKYPLTIAWRIKKHCEVIEKYLNPGEEVHYAFVAQKNFSFYEIFNTYVVVLTNKRIILAQKRLLFGHLYKAITPDMFNDLTIKSNIIWGKVLIDTVKELVVLSSIGKAGLDEIETKISEYMMTEKKKYIGEEK